LSRDRTLPDDVAQEFGLFLSKLRKHIVNEKKGDISKQPPINPEDVIKVLDLIKSSPEKFETEELTVSVLNDTLTLPVNKKAHFTTVVRTTNLQEALTKMQKPKPVVANAQDWEMELKDLFGQFLVKFGFRGEEGEQKNEAVDYSDDPLAQARLIPGFPVKGAWVKGGALVWGEMKAPPTISADGKKMMVWHTFPAGLQYLELLTLDSVEGWVYRKELAHQESTFKDNNGVEHVWKSQPGVFTPQGTILLKVTGGWAPFIESKLDEDLNLSEPVTVHQLSGTENMKLVHTPVVSPDGKFLAAVIENANVPLITLEIFKISLNPEGTMKIGDRAPLYLMSRGGWEIKNVDGVFHWGFDKAPFWTKNGKAIVVEFKGGAQPLLVQQDINPDTGQLVEEKFAPYEKPSSPVAPTTFSPAKSLAEAKRIPGFPVKDAAIAGSNDRHHWGEIMGVPSLSKDGKLMLVWDHPIGQNFLILMRLDPDQGWVFVRVLVDASRDLTDGDSDNRWDPSPGVFTPYGTVLLKTTEASIFLECKLDTGDKLKLLEPVKGHHVSNIATNRLVHAPLVSDDENDEKYLLAVIRDKNGSHRLFQYPLDGINQEGMVFNPEDGIALLSDNFADGNNVHPLAVPAGSTPKTCHWDPSVPPRLTPGGNGFILAMIDSTGKHVLASRELTATAGRLVGTEFVPYVEEAEGSQGPQLGSESLVTQAPPQELVNRLFELVMTTALGLPGITAQSLKALIELFIANLPQDFLSRVVSALAPAVAQPVELPWDMTPITIEGLEIQDWTIQNIFVSPDGNKVLLEGIHHPEGDDSIVVSFDYDEASRTLKNRRNIFEFINGNGGLLGFVSNTYVLLIGPDGKLLIKGLNGSEVDLDASTNQRIGTTPYTWDFKKHPPTATRSGNEFIFACWSRLAIVLFKYPLAQKQFEQHGPSVNIEYIRGQLRLDDKWMPHGTVELSVDGRSYYFSLENSVTKEVRLFQMDNPLTNNSKIKVVMPLTFSSGSLSDTTSVIPFSPLKNGVLGMLTESWHRPSGQSIKTNRGLRLIQLKQTFSNPTALVPQFVGQGTDIPLNESDLAKYGPQKFDLRSPLIISPDGKTAFINTGWNYLPAPGASYEKGCAVLKADRDEAGNLSNLSVFMVSRESPFVRVLQFLSDEEIIFISVNKNIEIVLKENSANRRVIGKHNEPVGLALTSKWDLTSPTPPGFAKIGDELWVFFYDPSSKVYQFFKWSESGRRFVFNSGSALNEIRSQVALDSKWEPIGPPIKLKTGNGWLLCFNRTGSGECKFFQFDNGVVIPYQGTLITPDVNTLTVGVQFAGAPEGLSWSVTAPVLADQSRGLFMATNGSIGFNISPILILAAALQNTNPATAVSVQPTKTSSENSPSLTTLLSAAALQLPGLSTPMTLLMLFEWVKKILHQGAIPLLDSQVPAFPLPMTLRELIIQFLDFLRIHAPHLLSQLNVSAPVPPAAPVNPPAAPVALQPGVPEQVIPTEMGGEIRVYTGDQIRGLPKDGDDIPTKDPQLMGSKWKIQATPVVSPNGTRMLVMTKRNQNHLVLLDRNPITGEISNGREVLFKPYVEIPDLREMPIFYQDGFIVVKTKGPNPEIKIFNFDDDGKVKAIGARSFPLKLNQSQMPIFVSDDIVISRNGEDLVAMGWDGNEKYTIKLGEDIPASAPGSPNFKTELMWDFAAVNKGESLWLHMKTWRLALVKDKRVVDIFPLNKVGVLFMGTTPIPGTNQIMVKRKLQDNDKQIVLLEYIPPTSTSPQSPIAPVTAPFVRQEQRGKGPDKAWFASRRRVEEFGKALLKLASQGSGQRMETLFSLFDGPDTFDVGRFVQANKISEPLTAEEVTSLVTFLETSVSGDVHAGTLSFPEAQRRVQHLTEWLGQPVTLKDVKSVMSVVRSRNIGQLEKGIGKLNPETVISLVVDANDKKDFDSLRERHPKLKMNITVVVGLFASEKTINTGAFEGAAKRILTQSPNRTLLVLPRDVAFSSGEFNALSPELMKLFIVTTLEDLFSGAPKAMSLDSLLRIARTLAVNA
jgi:hypothetical protein